MSIGGYTSAPLSKNPLILMAALQKTQFSPREITGRNSSNFNKQYSNYIQYAEPSHNLREREIITNCEIK